MATTSTSIPVPAPRAVGRKTWIGLALVTALLIGGVAAGIQLSRGGPEVVARGSAAMQAYQGITATAPYVGAGTQALPAMQAYQGIAQEAPYPDASARAGVHDRGTMSPRHRVLPAQEHGDRPTSPTGTDQCVIVAGRPIC